MDCSCSLPNSNKSVGLFPCSPSAQPSSHCFAAHSRSPQHCGEGVFIFFFKQLVGNWSKITSILQIAWHYLNVRLRFFAVGLGPNNMVLLENAFIILMWTWAEERGRPSSPCPYLITAHPSAMAWESSGNTAQFLSNTWCNFSWACGSLGVFWTRLGKIGLHRGWKKNPGVP